jgi:hypothetical protein
MALSKLHALKRKQLLLLFKAGALRLARLEGDLDADSTADSGNRFLVVWSSDFVCLRGLSIVADARQPHAFATR